MEINAEVYREAALEHVVTARELYDLDRYVLTHYVAGLSVECIFRAYRYRADPVFDARHDLRELYKVSRFADIIPGEEDEILAALGLVVLRWNNNHRYRSPKSLRKYLTEAKVYRGVKGDFMKESARQIVNAADIIVRIGVRKWKSSSTK